MIHSARTNFNIALAPSTAGIDLTPLAATRGVLEKSLTDAKVVEPAELKEFGKELAKVLFSEPVLTLYNRAANGPRVQISICATDSALKAIPWEFVYWPDVQSAPHQNRSIVRLVCGTETKRLSPMKLDSGIRVLLAASAPTDQPQVDWVETEAEMRRIFAATTPSTDAKSIELELVEAASADGLRKAVQKFDPHIVHFIGHGDPGGLMLIKHGSTTGRVVPANVLHSVLASQSTRLVILSACDTANVGNEIAPLTPIAEQLVQAGVPAVVANQMPISLRSVATFCGGLYSALLDNGNIDWAVNNGRIAVGVAFSTNNAATVEWGVPVLYRRPGCSQVFTPG
jgi:hypothetical protein